MFYDVTEKYFRGFIFKRNSILLREHLRDCLQRALDPRTDFVKHILLFVAVTVTHFTILPSKHTKKFFGQSFTFDQ